MTTEIEHLLGGIERYLSESWGAEVRIDNVSRPTTGARRINILFDANDGTLTRGLCATINLADGDRSIVGEVEARRFAEDCGVPVPTVLAVCPDLTVIGRPFFISERVDGETIPRRVLRVTDEHDSGAKVGFAVGQALGRLHSRRPSSPLVDVPSCAGLHPAEEELRKLASALRTLLRPSPVLALAFKWLTRSLPPRSSTRTLVHGEIRNGNILIGPDGQLRSILDWEKCSQDDDPMKDLAWCALRMWRFGRDEFEFGGFATRDDVVAGYESEGGVFDVGRFHWWKAMKTAQWAVGLMGQARQYLEGEQESIVTAASGRRVPEMEWDLLMLTNPSSSSRIHNN
jgi:aminoglycoside phosphotransferase (APT) family kinase protein